MASAAVPALLGVGAATSLVSAVSGFQGARSQAKALERRAEQEELRGKQISAANRKQLLESLQTIDALRSGNGLSIDSPGAAVARRETREIATENELAQVLSSNFQQDDALSQAAARRRAAPFIFLEGATNPITLTAIGAGLSGLASFDFGFNAPNFSYKPPTPSLKPGKK